jgi:hypothetical protein
MHLRLLCLLLIIALSGCSYMPWNRKAAASQQPAANTAKAPVQAAPPSATQSSSYMQVPGAYAGGPVPPMESNRTINEQDCTKEINLQAGNLKCR